MFALPTPGRLAQQSEFYHQLAQLTDAGLSLRDALQTQQKQPPASWLRQPISRLADFLNKGGTFGEAIHSVSDSVPQFDAALLEAGEQSGRLPGCFKLLADHYQERSRLAREVLSNLLYPAFLFHFAIFIGPLPELVLTWNMGKYLWQVGQVLFPLYAIILFLFWITNSQHGERWRGILESIANGIPVLGSARRNLALARFSAALHALLNAGVPIIRAWELSGAASGSVHLKRDVMTWRPHLEKGQTPAELVRESRYFPDLFANMYHTGEISGTLDDSLMRLQRLYQERGVTQFRAIAEWSPRIIYLLVVFMIAWRVLSFYMGYYSQVGEVLKM